MNELAESVAPVPGSPKTVPVATGTAVCERSVRQLRAMILGEQLAEERRRVGLSRQGLAERMGTDTSVVARIEQGQARNIEHVRAYAAAVDVTMVAVPDGAGYSVTLS